MADLGERRKILVTMLEAVYVDPVDERTIVALKPKSAFRALFQIATTQEGSGVVHYNENPPDSPSKARTPSSSNAEPMGWSNGTSAVSGNSSIRRACALLASGTSSQSPKTPAP